MEYGRVVIPSKEKEAIATVYLAGYFNIYGAALCFNDKADKLMVIHDTIRDKHYLPIREADLMKTPEFAAFSRAKAYTGANFFAFDRQSEKSPDRESFHRPIAVGTTTGTSESINERMCLTMWFLGWTDKVSVVTPAVKKAHQTLKWLPLNEAADLLDKAEKAIVIKAKRVMVLQDLQPSKEIISNFGPVTSEPHSPTISAVQSSSRTLQSIIDEAESSGNPPAQGSSRALRSVVDEPESSRDPPATPPARATSRTLGSPWDPSKMPKKGGRRK